MVAIELACWNRPDIRLLSADDLKIPKIRAPFQWQVDIGQRRKIGVIPDQVFGIEYKGMTCWFCLEADRGTMPITRGNFDQTSFQRKLLAYEATWTQNLHRSVFKSQRFRVLTVTTNQERVRGMKEACRGLAHGRGFFCFSMPERWRRELNSLLCAGRQVTTARPPGCSIELRKWLG